jgi:hypothetical protein
VLFRDTIDLPQTPLPQTPFPQSPTHRKLSSFGAESVYGFEGLKEDEAGEAVVVGGSEQVVTEQPVIMVATTPRKSSVYLGFEQGADPVGTVYGFGESSTDTAAEEIVDCGRVGVQFTTPVLGTKGSRFAAAVASNAVPQTPLPANPICGWGNSVTVKRKIPSLTDGTFCRRLVRYKRAEGQRLGIGLLEPIQRTQAGVPPGVFVSRVITGRASNENGPVRHSLSLSPASFLISPVALGIVVCAVSIHLAHLMHTHLVGCIVLCTSDHVSVADALFPPPPASSNSRPTPPTAFRPAIECWK